MEAGAEDILEGGSVVLLQNPHRMGRVMGQAGQRAGLGSHLGTRQTSFTGATSFTGRTFGASRARSTTFASGTLVGGVTATIRVSLSWAGLFFLLGCGWCFERQWWW